jgi:uncharacterized protein
MRAIAEGLFTEESPPRLIGGRNRATGRIVFPCPANADFEPYPLKREGTLWSYTIQRYRPIGYVALDGETIVEARLSDVAFDAIHIGMMLEMSPIPLDPDAADSPYIPAFRPVEVPA